MKRTIKVEIKVKLSIEINDDADDIEMIDEVIQEMDYDFTSKTENSEIIETEIIEFSYIDEKGL